MRTSMITTSGLRRSASATALAPSAASPMTRMCGARERERRSPSRTTSWSSTMRQVMSPPVPTRGRFYGGARSPLCRRHWTLGHVEPNALLVVIALRAGGTKQAAVRALPARDNVRLREGLDELAGDQSRNQAGRDLGGPSDVREPNEQSTT